MSKTDLTPSQMKVYQEHGEALVRYPISIENLARQLGVSRYTVRAAKAYAEEFGTVDTEAIPAIHLIIPDAHAKPGTDLIRFKHLGKEAEELGREAMAKGVPFRVISIGDFGDFPSLSSYDKGKGKGAGRTYAADLKSMETALMYIFLYVSPEVRAYTDWYWCEGNHEFRVHRYMNDNPELQGVLNGPYEVMEEYGWTVIPFNEWLHLDGVGYTHFMQSPGTGRAISGVNIARSLLLKGHRSVVVGHNHILDTAHDNDAYGNPIRTLSCGCFFDHVEDYAGQGQGKWWRGLIVLRDVIGGDYRLEERPLSLLHTKYENTYAR